MSNTPRRQPQTVRVKAIYIWTAQQSSELGLTPGDEIEVFYISDSSWAYGKCNASGQSGWFPITYTEDIVDREEDGDTQ
jgi:hypothetical protein